MDWLRFNKIYFIVSIVMIVVSVYGLLNWGLKLSVDFLGGSVLEYRIEEEFSTEDAISHLKENGIEISSIQTTQQSTYLFKLPPINEGEKEKIASIASELIEGELEELRFENVGPSIGPELIKKTIYAIVFAASGILLWVAFQFKSIKFGVSAILAMFHDSFILIGSFSLLGRYFGAEVDFLFVTALLTTLSFSVHDTIVVFDRIREIGKNDDDLLSVANRALTETMVRSLNNSFTIVFMLAALLLLGGTTIKWFATALLIGTLLGTYSSPFVAVPFLVSWDNIFEKVKSFRR